MRERRGAKVWAWGLVAFAAVAAPVSSVAYVFDEDRCADEQPHKPRSPNVMLFVDQSGSMQEPSNPIPVTQTTNNPTTVGVPDTGMANLPANDTDNPRNKPGLTLSQQVQIPSFAWVANNPRNGGWLRGSVSKFHMETLQEIGRFDAGHNPSRTAVDENGDGWIGSRGDGTVTHILWDSTSCPDKNGNGVPDTSFSFNGSTPFIVPNDECIAYQGQPKGWTIRGMAGDGNGKMWVGYSSGQYGVQSIDIQTHALGPHYRGDSTTARVWQSDDGTNFYDRGNLTFNTCYNYGLVADGQGKLYYSNGCRDRVPVFDTISNTWELYYTPGRNGFYGVGLDASGRVLMGGWKYHNGIRMLDTVNKKMYHFSSPHGKTTGVAGEPGTDRIWTSFYAAGLTGVLTLNDPANPGQGGTWTYVPTTKTGAVGTGNLSGVGNDLRGVGFDRFGNGWTLGLGSNRLFKIDANTLQRHSDLPIGKAVGDAGHYTYSDFTGSSLFSFTSPVGKWRNVYPLGNAKIDSVTVEAHVPTGTGLGIRYRGLASDGSPMTDWIPAGPGGTTDHDDYPVGAFDHTFVIPQSNDNPFVVANLELEVKLTTSDKGLRPVFYGLSFNGTTSTSSWDNAVDIAADLATSSQKLGPCEDEDQTKCDILRVGLTYFDSGSTTVVTQTGEDNKDDVTGSVYTQTATSSGLTNLGDVTEQIKDSTSLDDADRQNFALLITDGRENEVQHFKNAIANLCAARLTNDPPILTYAVGLGANTATQLNSLLAAAGGTGHCCAGANANCAEPARVEICDFNNLDALLSQTGSAPNSEVIFTPGTLTCVGNRDLNEVTALKQELRAKAKDDACLYKLNIPDDPVMYADPNYPQLGALADPTATQVTIEHVSYGELILPYCPAGDADCGLADIIEQRTGNSTDAARFVDEGFFFEDVIAPRSHVRLTPELCNEVAERKVRKARTQVACQCLFEGESCSVPGKSGRCEVGVYVCDTATSTDVCTSKYRPQPEVCNGLDDDCDGEIDIMDSETSNDLWNVRGALPEEYDGFDCGRRSVCGCGVEVTEHKGENENVSLEYADFLAKNWDERCVCGQGLEPEFGAQDSSSPDAEIEPAAGCATSGMGSGAPVSLAFLMGICLLGWRRRRRDDLAA